AVQTRGERVHQSVESFGTALAGSRELFETVLRNLHEGVLVTSAAGERVYANAEAARLIGYGSPEELVGSPPEEARSRFEIFDVEGEPLPPERLPARRALAGEEPEPTLLRFRAGPGGPERVSEVRAVAVRDDHGAIRYVISFFREVTDDCARE